VILRDSVRIKSPPEKVWRFIEDPERMKSWNPKVQSISPISWGERSVGYRYRVTYVMSRKANEFLAEIIEYRKPEKIVIRLTEANLPTRSTVNEIYELSPSEEGTLLEQRIEINNSGLNLFFRLLIAFIHRFGKPTEKRYLEALKELIERSA
jgi:carbon monoxide dehydrogenase subunit G